MGVMSKEEFRRKYMVDRNVKNFIVNNELRNKLSKRESGCKLTTKNKAQGLVPSDTNKQREEGLKELIHDAIEVRREEVIDPEKIKIKDLMGLAVQLIDNKTSPVTVNFTFGDLVKRVHEHPEKADIIDV